MRGRPPKPIEVHRQEGTLRPDRHAATPTVVGGRAKPKPPTGLTAGVRKYWRLIAEPLHEAGIFDQADALLILSAAVAVDRALTAGKDVEERGMLVMTYRTLGHGADAEIVGRLEANPAVKLEREAWAEFRQLADRLGVGPTARARLAGMGVEGKDVSDEFDELAELREARSHAA